MDIVSEVTRMDWSKLWDMPAMEFFTYCAYALDKREKEGKAIDRMRNKTTKHY